MGLNIKNEETCRLARALARLTGRNHDGGNHYCTARTA